MMACLMRNYGLHLLVERIVAHDCFGVWLSDMLMSRMDFLRVFFIMFMMEDDAL